LRDRVAEGESEKTEKPATVLSSSRPPDAPIKSKGRSGLPTWAEAIPIAEALARKLTLSDKIAELNLAEFIKEGFIDPADEAAVKAFLLEQKANKGKKLLPQPYRATAQEVEGFLAADQGKGDAAKIMTHLISGKESTFLHDVGAGEELTDFVRAMKSRPKHNDPEFAAKKSIIEEVADKYGGNAMLRALLAQVQFSEGDSLSALKSAEQAIQIGTFEDHNRSLSDAWRDYGRVIRSKSLESWNATERSGWASHLYSIGAITTTSGTLFDHGVDLMASDDSQALSFMRAGIGLNNLAEQHPDIDERLMALAAQEKMVNKLDDKAIETIFGGPPDAVREGIAQDKENITSLSSLRDQLYGTGDGESIVRYEKIATELGSFHALNTLKVTSAK